MKHYRESTTSSFNELHFSDFRYFHRQKCIQFARKFRNETMHGYKTLGLISFVHTWPSQITRREKLFSNNRMGDFVCLCVCYINVRSNETHHASNCLHFCSRNLPNRICNTAIRNIFGIIAITRLGHWIWSLIMTQTHIFNFISNVFELCSP